MKKTILYALCMSSVYLSNAQSLQKYLQVNAGGYWADMEIKGEPAFTQPSIPPPDYSDKFRPGAGYSAGISGGIIYKRFRVELGVNQVTLSRSYKFDYGSVIDPLTGIVISEGEARIAERYRHLIIPVSIGYNLATTGSRWTVSPFISASFSYNYKHETQSETGGEKSDWRESGMLGKSLRKTSFWGGAGVEAGYKLNRRFSIIAKPQTSYMITSFIDRENTGSSFKQHPLLIGGELGLRCFL